jgi:homoserine kinase
LLQLPFAGKDLFFVLVNPVFEAPTAEMRAVLPKEVPMKSMINNCCQGGSLVSHGPQGMDHQHELQG